MRQGTSGALAIALAIGSMLLWAPGAQAWVREDPCPTLGSSQLYRDDGTVLHCDDRTWMGGNSHRQFPADGRECPQGYKLAGTNRTTPFNSFTAHWNFWAEDPWVTWLLTGDAVGRDGAVVGFRPWLKNWMLWGGRMVRFFQTCDRDGARGLTDRPAGTGEAESGDNGADELDGTPEDDVLGGRGGDDELTGAAGDDEQYAGAGDDESGGGAGDDQILTGMGDDIARGGRGSDSLFDDEGNDELRGGRGGDRFSAHDRTRDRIDCGRGEDVVIADEGDRIAADCERVYTSREDFSKNPPA